MISEMRSIPSISEMDNGILICVGSGKQGKSCTLHSLVDICFRDREKYLLDTSGVDISIFPNYGLAHTVDDIPVGAIAIIEDVNRVFHSRGSSKDPTLQKWLGVISHKSNVVCITTQSMASTDIEFLRSQDVVVLHKRMFEEDVEFERPERQRSQMFANERIARAIRSHPNVPEKAWTFLPKFNECVAIPPVPWWSFANSHMLREVKVCS